MSDPNGLTDDGPGFIGPLMIIVCVLVFILLLLGLFMPDVGWEM
jgi:hypothetical protein